MLLYPSVVVPATAITAGNLLCDSTTANAFAAPIVSGSPYDFGPYRDGRSYLELYASGVLVAKALISKSKSAGESTAEKCTDPLSFSSPANWVNGFDDVWAISGGKATATNADAISLYNQGVASDTPSGKLYKLVTVCDSLASGTWANMLAGFASGEANTNAGTKTSYITAGTGVLGSGIFATGLSAVFGSHSCLYVSAPAATAALLESAPGVRGWIYKSATVFENSALTFKIIQIKRYPNPRKINGVSTHHA